MTIQEEDITMTTQEMIKRFNLVLAQKDGREAIRVNASCGPTARQIEEIRLKKQEIIAELKRQKAEAEAEAKEKEEATVRFMVVGWESHEVSVDTRYDIDEQLRKYADYYSSDMTFETAKEAYEEAIKRETEKSERKAKAESEREDIFAKAKETGEKQALRAYMDECDGTVCECSCDAVTVYAMPDGSTTQTRIHTH